MAEKLGAIRKANNISCKFGSLLICIFFYVQNSFPTINTVAWDMSRPTKDQINDLISQLGENFEVIMDNYFEEFKNKMRNHMRIPKSIVDKYFDDICFMVVMDFVYSL